MFYLRIFCVRGQVWAAMYKEALHDLRYWARHPAEEQADFDSVSATRYYKILYDIYYIIIFIYNHRATRRRSRPTSTA